MWCNLFSFVIDLFASVIELIVFFGLLFFSMVSLRNQKKLSFFQEL